MAESTRWVDWLRGELAAAVWVAVGRGVSDREIVTALRAVLSQFQAGGQTQDRRYSYRHVNYSSKMEYDDDGWVVSVEDGDLNDDLAFVQTETLAKLLIDALEAS